MLTLALADLAVRGGERVGLIGLSRPIASRGIIDRFAQVLLAAERAESAPPPAAAAAGADLVALQDRADRRFPLARRRGRAQPSPRSAPRAPRAMLLMIADPIEETFPFAGHTEFLETARRTRASARRARKICARAISRASPRIARPCAPPRARRGWDFALHRTDQSAAAALLGLTARLAERGPLAFARGA